MSVVVQICRGQQEELQPQANHASRCTRVVESRAATRGETHTEQNVAGNEVLPPLMEPRLEPNVEQP